MKRFLIALAIGAISAATTSPMAGTAKPAPAVSPSDPPSGFRRYALVVGANDGGASRIKLRYAGTDAAAFADVLTELGGVSRTDLVVLREPTREGFVAAMETMRNRIKEDASLGGRAELLVYYSGHSDETGLMFGREKLAYSEFRARIDAAPAKIRLAVVDACASGALTRLKGGSRLPAFSVDRSSDLSGYAFLTSSSGAEAAQESDRIRASYFTHFLITGLRGAADRNLDGKVTLGEAYEFAFQETLSQTEGTQAGAQHPSYDMRLTGTGDLVLTDLRGTSAGLVLDPALKGRIFVRGASGSLVAELQKQSGKKVELGLEPGMYDMSLDQGNGLYRALIKVDSQVHQPVSFRDFERVAREPTRSRGSPDSGTAVAGPGAETAAAFASGAPAPENEWIAARAAVVPSLGYPGAGSGPYSHNISLNLVSGYARAIHGAQISLGYNQAFGEMDGLQLGLVNSSRGISKGAQVAGLMNAEASSHSGLQAALLVNSASRITGLQAGAVNSAGRGRGLQAGLINFGGGYSGMQAGLVNTARSVRGLQAGVANFALRQRGMQLGLINYAHDSQGAVLGLLNFVGNGVHNIETTLDERSMQRTSVLLGGPYNYTYYSFDMKARYPRHLWGGSAGMGIHIPVKPLFADLDAGSGLLYNQEDWDNFSVHSRVRFLAGYAPFRHFNIFGGVSYNAEAWPGALRPNLNPEREGEAWGDDIRAHRWTGFFLGVRI
jgi:hypothetical protein